MKTRTYSIFSGVVAAFLLSPLCSVAVGEDEVSGSIDLGAQTVFSGRRDSAKAEEYRDLSTGVVGGAELHYENECGYYFDVEGQDLGQDDQEGSLTAGKYGVFKLEVDYSETPHRFVYDAKTLYSGIGSENLVTSDGMSQDLVQPEGTTTLAEVADKLNDTYLPAAFTTDLQLERKKTSSTLTYSQMDSVTLQLEVKNEQRDGTRPTGGNFGFFNAVEIAEPIDYDTTEVKVSAEYSEGAVYAKAHYYASVFDNNLDSLSYSNPFTINDSTGEQAYLAPRQFGPAATFEGANTGLMDLTPDNLFQQVSVTGSLADLPLQSRLSATASFGWMEQDEDLVAYTTNTSIVPGAAHMPPFDASNVANVPRSSADREVNTTLFNVALNSKPLDFMRSKIRYRFFQRDNDSDTIAFPGYVRMDAVWEDVPIHTEPIGYDKHNFDADFGFDICEDTDFNIGYGYERWSRDHREVSATDDNIFRTSIETAPSEYFSLRTSYELSVRKIDGEYDPTVPFGGHEPIPQIPQLRKYDEADRDKNEIKVLASVFPVENLSFTGSFTWGESDYDKSEFGLTNDKFYVWSVDADYAVEDVGSVFAFWSFEKHEASQKARQWTPGGIGDPFARETALDPYSNWNADTEDEINTVGGGVNVVLIQDTLSLKTTFSIMDADGSVDFASPLGNEDNDANPFIPATFNEVDDTQIYAVNPELTCHITESLRLSVGYLWEKYEVDDYNKEGFENAPTLPNGNYNAALLMGTQPYTDYELNLGYAKVSYDF